MPSTPLTTKILGCLALVVFCADASLGQPAVEGITVETLAEGFATPSAVALRPGGARSGPNLFVAEAATSRVLGISTDDSSSELVEVVKASGEAADGCRLLFRSRNRLLMGQSTPKTDAVAITEYNIDDDALPMDVGDRSERFRYESKENNVLISSMARNGSMLFVATGQHQWLLGGTFKNGPAAQLESLLRTVDVSQVGTPSAVAFGNKGYLVVVELGDASVAGDSAVLFYHPAEINSKPLLKVALDLDDVAAIAYSPATGNLYAANASTENSGIFRLDASFNPETREQSCRTVLMAEANMPRDLAFADDGTLYVVAVDSSKPEESCGRLLKITGGL